MADMERALPDAKARIHTREHTLSKTRRSPAVPWSIRSTRLGYTLRERTRARQHPPRLHTAGATRARQHQRHDLGAVHACTCGEGSAHSMSPLQPQKPLHGKRPLLLSMKGGLKGCTIQAPPSLCECSDGHPVCVNAQAATCLCGSSDASLCMATQTPCLHGYSDALFAWLLRRPVCMATERSLNCRSCRLCRFRRRCSRRRCPRSPRAGTGSAWQQREQRRRSRPHVVEGPAGALAVQARSG
eukprot:364675-Chlamydomonas_euryale.AAC.5